MASKSLRILAYLSGFFGVMMAAYGAHALQADTKLMTSWTSATNLLFFHVLAALIAAGRIEYSKLHAATAWLLLTGGMSFAAAVWIGVLTDIGTLNMGWFSKLAPYGGLTMMAGWLAGAIAVVRAK